MDLNFKDVISFLENPCLPTQQHYLYINIPARIEPNAKPFYLKIPEFGISVKSDNLMAKKVNNLTHLQLIDNVQNCWNFADGIIFPIGKPKQNFDIMAC